GGSLWRACGEHDTAALRRERFDKGPADAGARSGDEKRAILQAIHEHPSSSGVTWLKQYRTRKRRSTQSPQRSQRRNIPEAIPTPNANVKMRRRTRCVDKKHHHGFHGENDTESTELCNRRSSEQHNP